MIKAFNPMLISSMVIAAQPSILDELRPLYAEARDWLSGFRIDVTLSQDFTWAVVVGVGILVVAAYYLLVWSKVGRDPAQGLITQRNLPPEGLSPGMVRYLRMMSFDKRGCAAALVDLAVKNHVVIYESEDDSPRYQQSTPVQAVADLPVEEQAILKEITATSSYEGIVNWDITGVTATQKSLREYFPSYRNAYFATNQWYSIGGIMFCLMALLAMALYTNRAGITDPLRVIIENPHSQTGLGPPVIATGPFSKPLNWSYPVGTLFLYIGLYQLIYSIFDTWNRMRGKIASGSKRRSILAAFPVLLIGLVGLTFGSSVMYAIFVICVTFLGLGLTRLLPAYTEEGRRLAGQIEAFRRYLVGADLDPLLRKEGIRISPVVFEQYLPYALALDVEKRWVKRFFHGLRQSGGGADTYCPAWYRGNQLDATSLAALESGCIVGVPQGVEKPEASIEPASIPENTVVENAVPLQPRTISSALRARILFGSDVTRWALVALCVIQFLFHSPNVSALRDMLSLPAYGLIAWQIYRGVFALQLLSLGILSVGRLVKTETILIETTNDSNPKPIMTATYEYLANDTSYRVKVTSRSPKSEWREFDAVSNRKRNQSLNDQEYNHPVNDLKPGENEKAGVITSGAVAPAKDLILYDPDNPERALVVTISYPELTVGQQEITGPPINQIQQRLIIPALAALGIVLTWFAW